MFYSNKYPKSIFRELQEFPYSKRNRQAIFDSAKGSEDLVQRLKLLKKLPIHNGCVNCICWNEKGNKILSGSDDQHLIITDPFSYQVLAQYRTNHRANIFSAKFLPNTNDTGIVSCCGDGSIFYTDLSRIEKTQDCLFNCHAGTTYDIVTIPNDPNVFLSCGEDYTVRSFDLRVKNKCNKAKCKEDVIIQCRRAVTALTVNALMPCQIAIGCADSTARIYDRRMVDGVNCRLSPVDAFIRPGLERKPYRITSLNFSPEGEDLLVSYSSEHVYLFGLRNSKDMVFSTESLCGSDEEEGGMGVWCSSDKGDSVPVRRLRLRGDWSDTGPDARPHSNTSTTSLGGRRVVQGGLIQRMTDVLSRMLNDPTTRAALSQGGESEPSEQIEEGLGEYLDMDNRRPSQGSSVPPEPPPSLSTQTPAPDVSPTDRGSHDRGDVDMDVAQGGVEGPCDVNMDVSTQVDFVSDNSRLLLEGVPSSESRLPCDRNVSEGAKQAGWSSRRDTEENDSRTSETVTSMEIDDTSQQASCSADSLLLPTEPCKRQESVDSSADRCRDDDEDISPVKRAKDERSSPFDDDFACDSTTQDMGSEVGAGSDARGRSASRERIDDSTRDSEPPEQTEGETQVPASSRDAPGDPSTSLDPNVPSTSRPDKEERVSASTSRNSNLTDLTDELSTMFNGFKQKYETSQDTAGQVLSDEGGADMREEPREELSAEIEAEAEAEAEVEVEDVGSRQEQEEPTPHPDPEPEPEPEHRESGTEPAASTSTSTSPSDPSPSSSSSSSFTSTRFAVRMEKELCKAIRNARGESNQDDTVRLKKANIRMKYTGHRNARTMIKEATFWGSDYVMSGSDCGHVFVWSRDTGRLVMTLEADNHVVNCLQPHPTLPILATSGIDYDLKLWAPIAPEPAFDFAAAQELMSRNAIMLEETKDTITVPASFMIRMLACLNQLRRGGPRAVRRRRVPPQE